MTCQTIIELDDVGLQRGEKTILENINWRVAGASCAAILGPNGSGKSTIARILACHLWPTSGRVCVLGEEFGQVNLPALRRRIRLVQPAGPYDIDPALSARQVVLTGFFGTLNLYDAIDAAMIQRADQELHRLGLGGVAGHSYQTLSSGERARSLIARALITRPQLLLLDEPTSGLDLLAREQVLATIQRLMEQPDAPTVILITHHVEELPPATSNVLLLSEGRVVITGRPEQVLQSSALSLAYNCPIQVRQNAGRYYAEVSPDAWSSLL